VLGNVLDLRLGGTALHDYDHSGLFIY
jgi:hypothetical protein